MLFSKRVIMPEDLASVCRIAPGEQAAISGGLDDRAVQAIWAAVERLYQSGVSPAIGFCLRRRGQVLFNRTLGHAQGNAPRLALGFSNILGWANPDCNIACGLLMTGKITLGPHLRPYFALLNTICLGVPLTRPLNHQNQNPRYS